MSKNNKTQQGVINLPPEAVEVVKEAAIVVITILLKKKLG